MKRYAIEGTYWHAGDNIYIETQNDDAGITEVCLNDLIKDHIKENSKVTIVVDVNRQNAFEVTNANLDFARHDLNGLIALFEYKNHSMIWQNKTRALCMADCIIDIMTELKETIKSYKFVTGGEHK